ncbi:YrhK family protein [Pseudoprimorskyibacter insulae]|uniref:YrhK domain-containing protein n=1 Tax=Pseudoprimorskyibacter insulae TaxID=1695997 RepID=A0A2R8ANU3_9RHOB|nr:YrhK family protein [Pseudoprimorskyibacter insulae]SPF77685.1 hypothetical protein PRI8871_00269 [Pseudoprimorskyibacter insulae]
MLFDADHSHDTEEQRRKYAAYEIAYTIVDFTAALCFIFGSICFFYDSLLTLGTTLFLLGSLCFAAKPTLRLIREFRLTRMNKAAARRFKE